jgi:hypothetical protein
MAHKEPEISKQAAAGTSTDITFTIPEILEIIRKSGNATCQSVITAAYNRGLSTRHGTIKHKTLLPIGT